MTTEEPDFFNLYFQKNTAYYQDKLAKYKQGKKYTFNVFAFLFGLFWFIYRKMYLEAFAFIIFVVATSFLEEIIAIATNENSNLFVSVITTFSIATITGFFGNNLYLQKAIKTITYAKTGLPDEAQIKKYIKQKGGVSYLFLIVLALAIIFFFIYNNEF